MNPETIINKIGNKVVRHTEWYNNQLWGGATKFWHTHQFGLDIVNLGSGAGVHAFSYEGLPVKAANWALGPQSLVHDYNILKNYFSYIREGGCVIITVCPFSGLFSEYGKSHNFKYYTFLHPATILNFEESERQKALRIKKNPFKEMPVACAKNTIKEGLRLAMKSLKPTKSVDIELSAKMIMDGWKHQFGIVNLSAPLSDQHKTEISCRRETLHDMIAFCKERDLHPYIVIPVMHKSLSSMFTKEFKSLYMDSLTANCGAPVLDYMNDEMITDKEYYTTALFLSVYGAKKFTQQVIKDINEMENNGLSRPLVG